LQPAVAATSDGSQHSPAAVQENDVSSCVPPLLLSKDEIREHMHHDNPELKTWEQYSTMKNRVYAKGKAIEAKCLTWHALASIDSAVAEWVASFVFFRTPGAQGLSPKLCGKRALWMKMQQPGRALLLSRYLLAEETKLSAEIAEFYAGAMSRNLKRPRDNCE